MQEEQLGSFFNSIKKKLRYQNQKRIIGRGKIEKDLRYIQEVKWIDFFNELFMRVNQKEELRMMFRFLVWVMGWMMVLLGILSAERLRFWFWVC